MNTCIYCKKTGLENNSKPYNGKLPPEKITGQMHGFKCTNCLGEFWLDDKSLANFEAMEQAGTLK